MKVSIATHIRYLSMSFTMQEKLKILDWIEDRLTLFLDANDTIDNDSLMWFFFVKKFYEVDDKSKTRAFLYQLLVANGIVDDEIHDCKKYCRESEACHMLNDLKGYKARKENDYITICCDLGLCIKWEIDSLKNLTNYKDIDFFELDDSILTNNLLNLAIMPK